VYILKSCELKHLLGEVNGGEVNGGGGFPTDLIYSTLDNCKQLLEVAVETVCLSRFVHLTFYLKKFVSKQAKTLCF